jgi:hypothetical protein
MSRISVLVAGLAALLMLSAVAPASAGSLTFYMQSQHPSIVSLEFYSQARAAAWPGDGQVYIMDDYDTHSYSLSCNSGESICYGAWVRGDESTYWGVGLDNSEYCTNCCFSCDGSSTNVIVLNP